MTSSRNLRAIYAAAFLRSAGIGLMGVVLGIYLAKRQFSPAQIGFVLGAGLAGAALGTLLVSLYADRFGRRRTLIALSLLAATGPIGLILASNFVWLLIAAFIGTLNGMGADRAGAYALEQAIIPGMVSDERRTKALAWYNLVLDAGHALGALAGFLPLLLTRWAGIGMMPAYSATLCLYAACNFLSGAVYLCLTPKVEAAHPPARDASAIASISTASKRTIARFAGISGLDSLGGGLLTDALVAYWFFTRFGVSEASIAPLFFAAHALNAVSYLIAARLARRFGLINTMVFTHLPSSLFLLAVPFAPSFAWAAALFLARESLVEMDVPTRQSYLAAVVRPEERTFASGVSTLARNVSWATGPMLAGLVMQRIALAAPLALGAGAKIAYDLLLYAAFRRIRPPEESAGAARALKVPS